MQQSYYKYWYTRKNGGEEWALVAAENIEEATNIAKSRLANDQALVCIEPEDTAIYTPVTYYFFSPTQWDNERAELRLSRNGKSYIIVPPTYRYVLIDDTWQPFTEQRKSVPHSAGLAKDIVPVGHGRNLRELYVPTPLTEEERTDAGREA